VSGPNQLPNESREYRKARDELLAAELEARRAVERAAELRRQLPAGGAVPEDYMFQEAAPDGTVIAVRLSELFEPGLDTLILYSFMFSLAMPAPCTACSSILDSLDGAAVHVRQRAGLAVVKVTDRPDPAGRSRARLAAPAIRLLARHDLHP
jgi:predicted dithiol-disulfide oxidoreductase (DUF899 family)